MASSRRKTHLVAVYLVLISLLLAGPARAAEPPIPLDEYWRRLEETRALIATAGTDTPGAEGALLLEAADQWERITTVVLPNGSQTQVDHSYLVAQLRADPPDTARLESLLGALLVARDTWPQPKHDVLDAETLDRILARPEFQWQESPLETWWQRLQDRLWELIARLLQQGDDQAIVGLPLARYALTGLATLALVLVLVYAARGLMRNLAPEAALDPDADMGTEHLSATTALRRAQTLSADGDYRSAVRYLYLSSLLLLEERGLLRYDRSLTNREYLAGVDHRPRLSTIFRDVIDVFDRVWYGYQPVDEASYARYAALVADLRAEK